MIDITHVLDRLRVQRPIFHSEADFQHAFAWELQKQLPSAAIRLEFPITHVGKTYYLDIFVESIEGRFGIELKYKTRELSVQLGCETFFLRSHSAQDIGRYDFIKDLKRLELVTSAEKNMIGHAILLTNDSAYWKRPLSRTRTIDAAFRIHEGQTLGGSVMWGVGASPGTMRNREEPIQLHGTYALNWQPYSQPSANSYGQFRYLALQVGNNSTP